MKILIPFSGGVNSTFALWRWLEFTGHEIHARFMREGYLSSAEADAEEAAAGAIVAWLKANVRDFDYQTGVWPDTYVEKLVPLRPGFTNTMDYGLCEPRYAAYLEMIADVAPDGMVLGFSLENSSADILPTYRADLEAPGIDIYYIGVPAWETPIATGVDYDFDEIAATMSGRFEQIAAMPADLSDLLGGHSPRHPISSAFLCAKCLYEDVLENVSDRTPVEIDQYFAEHGCYGAWRDQADPLTYRWRGTPQRAALELMGIDPTTI